MSDYGGEDKDETGRGRGDAGNDLTVVGLGPDNEYYGFLNVPRSGVWSSVGILGQCVSRYWWIDLAQHGGTPSFSQRQSCVSFLL